jgi:hypothetical protein
MQISRFYDSIKFYLILNYYGHRHDGNGVFVIVSLQSYPFFNFRSSDSTSFSRASLYDLIFSLRYGYFRLKI